MGGERRRGRGDGGRGWGKGGNERGERKGMVGVGGRMGEEKGEGVR